MDLRTQWKKYEEQIEFNYLFLPKKIIEKGEKIVFQPKEFIVSRGEFPKYVYFIISGKAMGIRHYSNGSEYSYFQIDSNNGSVGILEVFSRQDACVASIISITEVTALRIESAVIYDYVMQDIEMMRRCLSLIASDLYKRSGNDGIYYYLDGINRVRYYLANYYNTQKELQGETVVVNAEYQDIANSVGISVRTVGRSIQKLRENGEIVGKNKKTILTEKNCELLMFNLQGQND